MASDAQGEWQPARIFLVHDWFGIDREDVMNTPDAKKVGHGELVRVKETGVPDAIRYWREVGCDSVRFYMIHQEDNDRLYPWRRGAISVLCEHEILTD